MLCFVKTERLARFIIQKQRTRGVLYKYSSTHTVKKSRPLFENHEVAKNTKGRACFFVSLVTLWFHTLVVSYSARTVCNWSLRPARDGGRIIHEGYANFDHK